MVDMAEPLPNSRTATPSKARYSPSEKDRKRDAQECYNKHDEVVLPVAHAFETEFSITGSLPSFRGHQNGCSGSIAVVSSLTRRLRTGPGEPIRIRRSYSHIAAPDSQYAISPR